jgi:hypothetical protein
MTSHQAAAAHHVTWERYMADREREAAMLRGEVEHRRRAVSAGAPTPTDEREGKETAIGQVDRRL